VGRWTRRLASHGPWAVPLFTRRRNSLFGAEQKQEQTTDIQGRGLQNFGGDCDGRA
jgi:hypothetical protein